MRNSTFGVLAVLACVGPLMSCGKTSHSDASTATSEHLTADVIASQLLADHFAPNQDGFEPLHPLTCAAAGKDGDRVVRCQASLADGQRDSQPAFLEIQLFDRDMKFAPLDKPVKDHVASLSGRWSLDIDPDITLTTKSTGQKAKLDGNCHQSLGNSNSPAFCAVLFTSRIFVITGVKPAHSTTTSITLAPGDGPDPNAEDINHAKELAVLAIALIGRSL